MSDPLVLALAWGVAAVAAAVLGQVAVFRGFRVRRRARSIVLLWAAAGAGQVAAAAGSGVDAWRIACGLVALGGAFVLYMPLYYTVAASLSVQMLVRMEATPDGLAVAELRDPAALRRLLAGRVETLVASGYLRRAPGGVTPTAKGRLLAAAFLALERLWRLEPGG